MSYGWWRQVLIAMCAVWLGACESPPAVPRDPIDVYVDQRRRVQPIDPGGNSGDGRAGLR
jgi:hypothetical protein